MKKLTLTLTAILLCTATTFANVQISETNFPCANFRNWLSQQSWGSKGYITDAEIASITRIDVSRQNISDLTGIKFFTNLQDLQCNDNQLTSLDVSGLTNLKTLDCQNNQLTSLNVSGLTNLWELVCRNNQLTSLDVSGLTNLAHLSCSNNQLTSLDVSGLANLQTLLCQNNQLTSLEVSGLNFLGFLNCSYNQLTSLDVSLTRLDHLNCRNNQLTSLNVSGLNFLGFFDCRYNQLTSLDLSGLDLNIFFGQNQTRTFTLTGGNENYSLDIELNNPTNLVLGLSYFDGTLTSTSNTITTSPFVVETGNTDFTLSGTLTLRYETDTNIKEIKNENRQAVAFYTITGIKLHSEPHSGIFIIFYDDGTSEKVMKK